MHLKVLWTALNVFSTHLGGNHQWVPPSFENDNNKKIYRAHKFYFTISSAVSSIQLHSRRQIYPLSWAENPRPPSPVWTTYCGIRRRIKFCKQNTAMLIVLREN